MAIPLRPRLRLPPGPVDLTAIDSGATPGFEGGKKDGKAALLGARRRPGRPAGAAVRRGRRRRRPRPRRCCWCCRAWTPPARAAPSSTLSAWSTRRASRITSFKAPTEEELRARLPLADPQGAADQGHDRRLRPQPLRGRADRRGSASWPRPTEIERRYDAINAFEAELAGAGITIVKCMLHISADTQKERLLARLDDPTKYWKFNPGDIDERGDWADYREAYEIALERTNTEVAPWYVVPSDHKWYRNLAIGQPAARDAHRHGPAVAGRPTSTSRSRSARLHRRDADRVIGRDRRPSAVTRYVTPLREGGSLPGIVEADDLGTYVCKFRGAGQGVRVLVAEVVVAELAERHRAAHPAAGRRSTSTPRSPATRPTRRSRTCSTPAPGSTSASTSCPARSATTATSAPTLGRRRPGAGALARRVLRQRRPLLAQPQPAAVARRPLGHRPRRRLYFHHGWPGGVGDPARFAGAAVERRRPRLRATAPPSWPPSTPSCAGCSAADVFAEVAGRRCPTSGSSRCPAPRTPRPLRAAYVAFLTARLGTRQWLPVAA